jgi:phosphonate transport system substrate-binding protein
MKMRTWAAALAASAMVLAACGSDDGDDAGGTEDTTDAEDADGDDPRADWPDELVLTLTPSSEAQALIDDAGPLAAVLEERLGIPVDHFVPTDYAGVLVALEAGQTHVAGGLGPQQMVQAADQVGAELILQSVRFGESVYVTQWFTNDPDTYCDDDPVNVPYEDDDGNEYDMLFCNGVDTAATSEDGPFGADAIANVEGRRLAFVDQGSASGHLVPSVQLFNAGVDPQTGVEEIFAGGHDNSVLAVYRGDADVGVSFNDAREIVVDQAEDVGQEVVVFGWSFPIPNDGFAVGPDLPEDLKEEITAALVDFAATEEGQETLGNLYNIDDLVEITDTGIFDPIRTLIQELGDLLDD